MTTPDPALARQTVIRAISDGYSYREITELPGVPVAAIRHVVTRYGLQMQPDGTFVVPEDVDSPFLSTRSQAREWVLAVAMSSRSRLVRGKAIRIEAALAELQTVLRQQRLNEGTRRRVGMYRQQQITSLQAFKATLRSIIAEVDDEVTRVRNAGDASMARTMDQDARSQAAREAS
jgi:hypothetical protein